MKKNRYILYYNYAIMSPILVCRFLLGETFSNVWFNNGNTFIQTLYKFSLFICSKMLLKMIPTVGLLNNSGGFLLRYYDRAVSFSPLYVQHSLIDIINCNWSCAYNLLFCTSNLLNVLFISLFFGKYKQFLLNSLIYVIVYVSAEILSWP